MDKTLVNLKPVDPEDTKTMSRLKEVRRRIASARPERLCDDDREWPRIWPGLLKRARNSYPRDEAVREQEILNPEEIYSFGEGPMAVSEEERDHDQYMAALTNRDD